MKEFQRQQVELSGSSEYDLRKEIRHFVSLLPEGCEWSYAQEPTFYGPAKKKERTPNNCVWRACIRITSKEKGNGSSDHPSST